MITISLKDTLDMLKRDEDQRMCLHKSHNKWLCLDCGKDITEDLAAEAERKRDEREGR